MKVKVKLRKKELPAEEVFISTEFIKLDSMLKFAVAVESGGEAKEVILEGLVSVNGEICTQRGKKLRAGDIVEFDGRRYKIAAGKDE